MAIQGGIQNIALCSLFTLYFGNSPLMYSPAPRGDCENCCPIREAKDIKFLLYTRKNPVVPKTLYLSDEKRLNRMNKTLPLIFYMHGFSEQATGGPGSSSHDIKNAFLETGNYNVILVDWSPITALPWYSSSVASCPRVGRYVARFLRFLVKKGVLLENIHVIGFSLGAEVAGYAGKILREWGILLPRITGLDPAFPLFMSGDTKGRLSDYDAKFVDVIHSDGGFLGVPWALGHADFYPNGGMALQPGCVEEELSKNRWLGIIVGCSHQRAWQYFIESIRRPRAFLASKCEPSGNQTNECDPTIKAFMGMRADSRLRGKFYLTTNGAPPFGRNGRY